ncbi:MAG: PKD-like domain-containing protein [Bacteroidota bacterium]
MPTTDDDGDGITSYDVSAVVGPGLTGVASTATGTTDVNLIAGDIFTNLTNASVTVVYTVTPYIGTCVGTSFNITVEVDPEPVFTGNLNTTICSDDNTGVIIPNVDDDGGTITSFDVSAVVAPGLSGTATTGNNQANVTFISGDSFENLTNTSLDVIYTVTPYFGTCEGTAFNIVVTVDPEPVFTGSLDATICSDNAIGVILPALDDDGNGITSYDVSAAVGSGLTGIPTTATGTTNINLISGDAFNNVQGDPVNVIYTITPYIGTCQGADFTITVTIGEEPVFTGNLNRAVCSDEISGIVLPNADDSGDAITSYDISAVVSGALTGSASVGLGVTNINQIFNDSYTNLTNAASNVIYTVTPYIGSCAGADIVITLTVNPEPVFTGNLDATVCSDEVLGISLPGADDDGDPITTYDVTAVVGAGLIGAPSTAVSTTDVSLIASDQYNNVTSASIDVVYTVTPYRNGCQGASFTITATISPEPVFTANLDVTQCSDLAIGVTLPAVDDSGDAITSYDVSAVAGANLSGTPSTATGTTDVNFIAGDIFNNVSNASDIVTYTITPYIGLCAGAPFNIVVTIDLEPLFTGNLNASVCSDEITGVILPSADDDGNAITSFNITAVVDGGLTGLASTGAGVTNLNLLTNDVFNNVTNASANVTYTVVPFIGVCEGSSFDIVVIVDPEPLFTGNLDNTVCSSQIVGITLPAVDDDGGSITEFDIVPVVSGGLIGSATSGTGITDANAIFNDVFTNPTAAALTVEYTITPYTNGCEGDQFTIIATIDQEPVFTDVLDQTICSDDVVGVLLPASDDSGDAITSYDVVAVVSPNLTGSASTATATTDINLIAADTYNNVTNQSEDVVYTITPYIGICDGAPFDIVITVDPEPVFTASLDNTVCSDDVTGVVLPTSDDDGRVIDSFDVSAVVGGSLSGFATTATGTTNRNLILNDVFTNTTNGIDNVVYTVTPYFGACSGTDFTITVTIDPEPVLDGGLSPAPVCSDVPSGITLIEEDTPPSVTAVAFDINSITVGPDLVAGGSNAGIGTNQPPNVLINDVFTNTSSGDRIVTYNVTPVAASGCKGDPVDVIFTIKPAPQLANLDVIVCSDDGAGTNITLGTQVTSAPADSYDVLAIRVDAGLVADALNATPSNGVTNLSYIQDDRWTNPTNGPLTVEYDIRPVTAAPDLCQGPVTTVVVIVEPNVIVTDPADENICSGGTTNISVASPTTPTSGGITFNITSFEPSGLVTGQSFFLQVSNPSVINDVLVNNSDDPQTVTYTLTPTAGIAKGGAGCPGTAETVDVTVEPKPRLVPSATFATVCEDDALAIDLLSPTNPTNGATVEFVLEAVTATGGVTGASGVGTTFTDGQVLSDILSNPTTANQTVTYEFRPQVNGTLGGNCTGDLTTIVVTVTPRPIVTPSSNFERICSGDFINISLPTDVANSLAAVTVVDNPDIIGEFDIPAGVNLFQSLINTSNVPQTLTYTVEPFLLIDNSCTGPTETITVIVDPIPDVIVADPNLEACNGEIISIPLDGNTPGTTFNWSADLPDGTTASGSGTNGDFINVTMNNPGTTSAFVTFTINSDFNGCTGLIPGLVFVNVSPEVDGSIITDNDVLCAGNTKAIEFELIGAAPFSMVLSKTENGVTTTETLTNLPSRHIILATQTVSYSIIEITDATGRCTANPTDDVTIQFEEAIADFTINGSKSPAPVTLDFNTGTVTVDIVLNNFNPSNTYELTIGEDLVPVTGPNLTYTFDEPSPFGSIGFLAELNVDAPTVTLPCNDVESFFIQVVPAEPTVLSTSDITEGCSPLTVNFEGYRDDLSLSRNVIVEELTWDFGDGSPTIQSANPTHTFTSPGVYSVVLRGSNGYPGPGNDQQADPITIRVLDNPVADFRSNQDVIFIPDQAFRPINNSSTFVTDWFWDWGDGNFTSGQEEAATPEHIYEQEGQYLVQLTASVDYGNGIVCSDSDTLTVNVEEGGFTRTPNAFTPSLDGPRGGAYDPLNPGTAGDINDVFLPITEGVEEFQMVIFDRWGNLIFESNDKNFGWDGYDSKGNLLPAGVYVYRLDLLLSDGNRTTRVGDVTLIR